MASSDRWGWCRRQRCALRVRLAVDPPRYGCGNDTGMAPPHTMPVDRGWFLIMTDMGMNPADILRQAGLPEDLFANSDARISVADYFHLWNTAFSRPLDPCFPIVLVENIGLDSFHPMVFAALCSQNLTMAAERIATYKRLSAPMAVTVKMRTEGLFVQKRWLDETLEVPRTLAAIDLLILVHIARIGTRARLQPVRVVSQHPMEPLDAYVEYFGVTPEVGPEFGVTFSKADAVRPFATASEALWETFEPELQRQLAHLNEAMPLNERVSSMLLESLPGGETSIDSVARRLGLSARTLQRRLKADGVLFKDLVRVTREKLARHYITRTELAYGEIAFLLGFDEPSSFFRAFRTWTGRTPESFRTAELSLRT